jgi:predicted amidophosphoribosyltransferase
MTARLDGKGHSIRRAGEGLIARVVADVCNDAGGVRWCPGCQAAHGAWNAACPRCGRALVALPRLSRIKREAA